MEFSDRQIFYVSSHDRSSGDTNNFSYTFNLSPKTNYDYVGVLAASIPKSYYLISSINDTFILSENGTNVNIIVPHGNYTITAWVNTLNALLNSSSPNNYTYAVYFSTSSNVSTGLLKFTVSDNGGVQPTFIIGSNSPYRRLGFNLGTYSFNNNSLSSVNVISLQLISALFIHSTISDNKDDSVLQEIYSNTSDYSYITYQATQLLAYSKKISFQNSTSINASFYLTDEDNNFVDLNGLAWNFTIVFFKLNNALDMIRDFIKLQLIQ